MSLNGKEKVSVSGYTKTGECKGRVKFEDLILHCDINLFTTKEEVSSGGRMGPKECGSILFPLCTGADQDFGTVPKSLFLACLICHSFHCLTQVMPCLLKGALRLKCTLNIKKVLVS